MTETKTKKIVGDLIHANADKKWTVRKIPAYPYTEQYLADGVPMFTLTWYDKLSPPCATIHDTEKRAEITWECPDCNFTQGGTFLDLIECGAPRCSNCAKSLDNVIIDCSMKIIS